MVVGGGAEANGKVDASEGSRAFPWHDAVERRGVTPEPRSVDLQELQGASVEDVEAAASVHQYLGEPGVADDWVDNKRVLPGIWDMVGVVISIKGDRLLRPVEVSGSGHLDQEDLLAFLLLLARRKACRGSAKDHEGVVHLGEPVVLVIVPIAGAFLLGIVVGVSEPGVVTPQHGAILEGVLDRALVVRAGFLKHVVERPRAFEASGILAFCGRDQISPQDLLLPQAPLLLSLGEAGGRGLGGLIPLLTLGVAVGEDGSNSLLTRGEVGGDVEERGS